MAVFNEDTRVKIPATIQYLKIGYKYQSLRNADVDFHTKIFMNRFKPALEKINRRKFSYDEIKEILMDIDNVIKNHDLGKEFYKWIINPLDRVKLIDFENVDNNDFAVVDELPFNIVEGTEEGSFRPDINILINGMPLAFLEVKKPNNEGGIQQEFDRMIKKRLKNRDYAKYFNLIQMVCFSNNMEYEEDDDSEDVKAGSFYTTPNGNSTSFSFFREDDERYIADYPYKDISENKIKEVMRDCGYKSSEADTPEFKENLRNDSPCNSFVTSVFDKERFLYFLQYGIMFVEEKVPQKHIMRYPQFFATRKIIERLESGGKGGIIWHTQGSGKTGLAAFANRVVRDYYGEKNINTRFFFVVDRIELLNQASTEFKNRGLNVVNCSSRADFTKELNKSLSTNIDSKSIGEVCVVNIQKFEETIPEAKNDYDANVQRVFFIDEAHRSYKMTGEFFKNLMTCDTNAVYIALTGTPLLTKKERSNLKFGDYIHKYFYDKSIADGYTLKIKKENIDTVAKKEILNNLQIEDTKLDEKEVYESPEYINDLGQFVEKDFNNFRLQNGDKTIGGMVVCRSNPQAKMMQEWFNNNSKLSTGLVISDENNAAQSQINKSNQLNFRETNAPDILIVNMMLTTGYDVKRLKKMYLLRGPHAQSLLQTISRVNRPYKSPTGKIYKYGYIVDFVDITHEYDKTVEAYIKELEEDLNENGENEGSLKGLVINKDDINKKYHEYQDNLDEIISTDNLEKFSKQIANFNKDALFKIKRLLNGIKECYTEFILSSASDYAKQIDSDKVKKLTRTVQERIDFINLKTNTVSMMDVISNEDIVHILYEFIKTKISILNLGELSEDDERVRRFTDIVKEVQNEVKKNKNKEDVKIVMLDELLQKIFNKLEIADLDQLDDISDELLQALCNARDINYENDRLSRNYGGNFGFVKTYQDAVELYQDADKKSIERLLLAAYEDVKDNLDNDVLLIQGRDNFIASIKHDITKILLKEKIYSSIKKFYDKILSELYTNIQLFK
ncbi:MAG: DEAD/DEAH box helicase family protein [Clostridium sp.]|uniref:DEAD/DEAH box helicase family protein n=1 Tax=Clostridium sp. TaxID=1506 RepID=UPI002A8EB9E8|nr:DEAD/DEAH box helicase family protein [Clostridium sp.]MDY5096789.1 DEAD/DEAH box helicase family protein [Clostridium sp.]